MIEILLFIVWLVITFFIFKTTKEHNNSIEYKIYKATWEPFLLSFFMGFILFMYWFAHQL